MAPGPAAAPSPSDPALLNADARAAAAAAASAAQTRSLVRAAHAVVSVFPGDVARGVPTVVYLPLIANPRFRPSEQYRRNMAAGGSAAGEKAAAAPSADSGSAPSAGGADASVALSSSSLSPSVHFDPRANFLSGGFCATLNFAMEPWQSEAIMALSYANCWEAAETLRAALQRIREEKRRLQRAQRARTETDAQRQRPQRHQQQRPGTITTTPEAH